MVDGPSAEGGDDLGFPAPTVLDEAPDIVLGLVDGGAVGGPVALVVPVEELLQAGQVVEQVTVGW